MAPYLFAGIQLLHRRLFDETPGRAFSLVRLFDRAEAAGRLSAIVHDGDWYHVGNPEGLALTRNGRAIVALDTKQAKENLVLLEPPIADGTPS